MFAHIKRFFTQMLKDFDLYITILVAIVVFVLGIVGVVNSNIIASATLAVLALLASSILRIRKIGPQNLGLSDIFQLRSQLLSLEQRLANVQKLDVCAMSNITFGTTLKEFVVDKVEQGCQMRFVFLNPYNTGLMKSIAPLASPTLDVDDHTTQIMTALNSLTKDPRLANKDKFQVRVYDYALPHSIMISDGNAPQGKLRIELIMSNHMPAKSPGVDINKRDDAHWFGFFQREFEDIWARAHPYETSNISA